MSSVSYLGSRVVEMLVGGSGGIRRVDADLLDFACRLECRLGSWLLRAHQFGGICCLPILIELCHCHLLVGDLGALLQTLFCSLSIASDGDDSLRPWHLHIQIKVTWSGHETYICWTTKYGVVGTLEVHHLEREFLLAEVFVKAKDDI